MKKPPKIQLTENQAKDILHLLNLCDSFLGEFLRHDDWDADMSPEEKHRQLSTDRLLNRMKKLMKEKLAKELK